MGRARPVSNHDRLRCPSSGDPTAGGISAAGRRRGRRQIVWLARATLLILVAIAALSLLALFLPMISLIDAVSGK
jgi:hypothetical protein